MAFNAFANFGDIKGESTDKDHKDWVMILSYDHGVTQPASVTQKTAGGRSAEAVNHSEFKIVKLVDAATPKLYEAACKGTHIPEVTIEVWRAGGDPLKYLEVKLKEVLISGVVTSGNPSGQHGFPTETVSLVYGAIEWTYTKQKPDGTAGGNVAAKWNVSQGAAA
ncbi:MAG: type VI secretion system tube protein Hcp [Acidobacteriia bacterium]|nr:type VI secretion system tube protein Hcp [Terriglobia bacterium]